MEETYVHTYIIMKLIYEYTHINMQLWYVCSSTNVKCKDVLYVHISTIHNLVEIYRVSSNDHNARDRH